MIDAHLPQTDIYSPAARQTPSKMAKAKGRSARTLTVGPYRAEVIRVIDADTLEVAVDVWPGLRAEVSVRVRGIDAPETRTTCKAEKRLGERAAEWVRRFYPPGALLRVERVERGSFAGRVIADVARWRSDRWLDLAGELLDRDFALPFRRGQQAIPWCLIATEREAAE